MLRPGQLLPPKGLLSLGFDTGRFPPMPPACYGASWQLPRPDLHRQASTNLHVGYFNRTTSFRLWFVPHAAGHEKPPLVPDGRSGSG